MNGGNPSLFSAINKSAVEEGIVNAAQGGALPNIRAGAILDTKLLVSNINLIEKFNAVFNELFERKLSSRKQYDTLTKLRDTLLPQLLSGGLQPPDAEQASCGNAYV